MNLGELIYTYVDSVIFIAIGGYCLFKPEVLKKIIDNKLVVRIIAIVCLAYGFFEIFNLF